MTMGEFCERCAHPREWHGMDVLRCDLCACEEFAEADEPFAGASELFTTISELKNERDKQKYRADTATIQLDEQRGIIERLHERIDEDVTQAEIWRTRIQCQDEEIAALRTKLVELEKKRGWRRWLKR